MAGRPKAQPTLTPDQVEELAAIGCSDAEIAVLASVSEATVKRHFEPHIKRGRANLRERLRKAQISKALGFAKHDADGAMYTVGPDTPMLIWLGKQYLGQRDPQKQVTVNVTYDDIKNMSDDELERFIEQHHPA